MKVFHPITLLACAGLACASLAQARPSAQQTEVLTPPGAAATTPSWGVISRGGTRAYLVNMGGVQRSGEVTTIKLARVSINAPAGDYSHTVDDYEFKCGPRLVRIAASTEYGSDGATGDAVPDPSATWEDIPANSLDGFVAGVACGDQDTTVHFPSIKAFLDSSRQ